MIRLVLIGCILIILTSFVHTLATLIIIEYSRRHQVAKKLLKKLMQINLVVLVIFLAVIIESVIWALTYYWVGAFDTFEESIYFSLVTYTTLGYGDLVLTASYRLIGAIQAANGILIFGWSTAIVVAALQKVLQQKNLK